MAEKKYHISPKTGRPNLCEATIKDCPVGGAHFATKDEAREYGEKVLKEEYGETSSLSKGSKKNQTMKETVKSPESIIPAPYSMREMSEWEIETYIHNAADYEYETTDYYDEYAIVNPDTAKINKIDTEFLARSFMKTPVGHTAEEDVKQLKEYLDSLELNDTTNYSIDVSNGYYGEVDAFVEYVGEHDIQEKINEFYYAKDNAIDSYGVLEYVRSKGQATKGLKPIDAIKEQLKNENDGKNSIIVNRANRVISKQVNIKDIEIPANKHYDGAESREIESKNDSKDIAGVVVYKPEAKKYILVDGYHRLKGLNDKGRKRGNYIVLS